MSKIAILSDIHGNADALQRVLDLCGSLGIDKYASLGDVVGYNAEPQLCVRMVRELNPVARVRGNHDDYTVNDDDDWKASTPTPAKQSSGPAVS